MAKFKEGELVELLPGKELVYPRAQVASRGTVTRSKTDDFGFEQVYIVWDREHWRYNGEKDGWTYASHFRPVDDTEILHAEGFDLDVAPTKTDEEIVENYLETLMTACDKAAESDGFFFIALKRDDEGRVYFEVMGAAIDEEIAEVSSAEVFRFIESELRRREQ